MATKKPGKGRGGGPSGLTPEQAQDDLKKFLKEARASIMDASSLDILVRTHLNADRSVDGELRVQAIPDEYEVSDVINELMFGHFKPKRGLWIAVGLRHADLEGTKSGDSRYRGLIQVNTYYGRYSIDRLLHELGVARRMGDNLAEAGRLKPQQVYVRFHWNKKNQKPAKRYDRRERGNPDGE